MLRVPCFSFLLLASTMSSLLAQAPQVLKIGDPAPALKVDRWIKGTPQASLEKGKVYVVEFWATWCGPCRDTIPHLTEMAKKHAGRVTFIGVNIWERPKPGQDIDKVVDDFVKTMGNKMDYSVCRDSKDEHMAKAWMQASGRQGIPSAFIVDKNGIIAWMGHPMNKMEMALDGILEGKYDLKAAALAGEKEAADVAARQAKQLAVKKAWEEVNPGIQAALKASEWGKALGLIDQAEAKYPELKQNLRIHRFKALLHSDEAKAKAFLEAETANPDAKGSQLASVIVKDESLPTKWFEIAVTILEKELKKPHAFPLLNGDLAKAYFRLGRAKDAVAAQEKIIVFAKENHAPDTLLRIYETELKTYKAAVK